MDRLFQLIAVATFCTSIAFCAAASADEVKEAPQEASFGSYVPGQSSGASTFAHVANDRYYVKMATYVTGAKSGEQTCSEAGLVATIRKVLKWDTTGSVIIKASIRYGAATVATDVPLMILAIDETKSYCSTFLWVDDMTAFVSPEAATNYSISLEYGVTKSGDVKTFRELIKAASTLKNLVSGDITKLADPAVAAISEIVTDRINDLYKVETSDKFTTSFRTIAPVGKQVVDKVTVRTNNLKINWYGVSSDKDTSLNYDVAFDYYLSLFSKCNTTDLKACGKDAYVTDPQKIINSRIPYSLSDPSINGKTFKDAIRAVVSNMNKIKGSKRPGGTPEAAELMAENCERIDDLLAKGHLTTLDTYIVKVAALKTMSDYSFDTELFTPKCTNDRMKNALQSLHEEFWFDEPLSKEQKNLKTLKETLWSPMTLVDKKLARARLEKKLSSLDSFRYSEVAITDGKFSQSKQLEGVAALDAVANTNLSSLPYPGCEREGLAEQNTFGFLADVDGQVVAFWAQFDDANKLAELARGAPQSIWMKLGEEPSHKKWYDMHCNPQLTRRAKDQDR